MPWLLYQAGPSVDIFVPSMLVLLASDERHYLFFVLWRIGAVEPLGLRDESFTTASHGEYLGFPLSKKSKHRRNPA